LSTTNPKAALEPLIDTDVWIDFLRGQAQAVRFIKALPNRVFISAVSVAELHVGVREGVERQALDELLSTLEVLDLNTTIATKGGLLRRDYGRSHGVGLNDALIAATAQEHGLQLCTLNVKHYPALAKAQLRRTYSKA
jgi:predicted nucleic acid-binding protein